MNSGELISLLTLAGSFLGIGILFVQIRQASIVAKTSLLFSINRDLNSYTDVASLIVAGVDDDWVNTLGSEQKERLLDYASYFEGIQLSMERRLFRVEEVDAFFSNRFFRMTNNTGMRKHVFSNFEAYDDAFRPIVALHQHLTAYRERKGLPVLYGGSPLQFGDSV
jgi:hypothetical protein